MFSAASTYMAMEIHAAVHRLDNLCHRHNMAMELSMYICLLCTATVQSIVLVVAAQRHTHSLRE